MKKSLAATAAVGLFATAGAFAAFTTPAHADEYPSDKVFVCKYVGKPGVDERLQTGNNPISVSVNAIPLKPVKIGSEFADKQGRSVVIAWDMEKGDGQRDEPTIEDCEKPGTPDPEPSETPKPEPTDTPKPEPTDTPKPEPTDTPKPEPTETPTVKPTPKPTPTVTPTPKPTAKPTPKPTKPAPKPTPKPSDGRGVAAKTGGEGDLTALGLAGVAGVAGLAVSGAALAASRRKN